MSALKHKDTAVLTANRVKIIEKIRESAISVLPIVVIVLVLCLTIAPVGTDLLLCFLIGTIFVIVGMGLFSLGAEASMTPIGNRIGTALTKTRNLPLILIVSFLLGFAVTIAEPDLQVLAETVPHINNTVLLVTVGLGVGFFLSVCMLRIVTGVKLRWLLIAFYGIVFILASLAAPDFLSVAFDSGGVASGPMTATFMLQFMIGASTVVGGNPLIDAFGVVAMVAMMPLISIQMVGFIYSRRTEPEIAREQYGDDEIIELWEVNPV